VGGTVIVNRGADTADLLKIEVRADDEAETLWAETLGGNLRRLDNTSWFAYGVSWPGS
jgi:hypothetical protein